MEVGQKRNNLNKRKKGKKKKDMSYRKVSDLGTNKTSYEVMEVQLREHKNDIIKKNTVVVVDIYANWCGPCKQLEPEYASMANRLNSQGVCLCVKENLETGLSEGEFKITHVPTFIIYYRGHPHKVISGTDLRQVENEVKALINSMNTMPEVSLGGYGKTSYNDGESSHYARS